MHSQIRISFCYETIVCSFRCKFQLNLFRISFIDEFMNTGDTILVTHIHLRNKVNPYCFICLKITQICQEFATYSDTGYVKR